MVKHDVQSPGPVRHIPAPITPRTPRVQGLPKTKQEICAFISCPIAILLVLLSSALLQPFSGTYPPGAREFLLLCFIVSILLFVLGFGLLRQTRREFSRVFEVISSREEITIDSISNEAGVPYSRARIYVLQAILYKSVQGRLIDETFTSGKVVAERIDAHSVRCPNCGVEMDLPEED